MLRLAGSSATPFKGHNKLLHNEPNILRHFYYSTISCFLDSIQFGKWGRLLPSREHLVRPPLLPLCGQDPPFLPRRALGSLFADFSLSFPSFLNSCPGCSYDSGCCCAPRDALPIIKRQTVRVYSVSGTVTRTRTRYVYATKTATVTAPKLARDVKLVDGFEKDEEAEEPVEIVEAADELESSSDEGRQSPSLFARHLCPRCPTGVSVRPASILQGTNKVTFCCPNRKVVTKTVTRKVVRPRTVFRTVTKTRTRTSTLGGKPVTTSIGARFISSLDGSIFRDVNGNGLWDQVSEQGAAGITINLWKLSAARRLIRSLPQELLATNQTGPNGEFVFHFKPVVVGTRLQITQTGSSKPLVDFSAQGGSVSIVVAATEIINNTTTVIVSHSGGNLRTSTGVAGATVSKPSSETRVPTVTDNNVPSISSLQTSTVVLDLTSTVEAPTTATTPVTETTTSERTTSLSETTSTSESKTTSTRTTFTRTTSKTKTTTESQTKTTTTSKTTYTPDASSPPIVSNGSVGVLNWQTEWTGDFGSPAGSIKLICVDLGDPCTATPLLQSDSYTADQVSSASVIGLEQGKNYTCYALLTPYGGGTAICSPGTPVRVSPGLSVRFMHPNGTYFKFNNVTGSFGLRSGDVEVFRSYASPVSPESIRWRENFMHFWNNRYSSWLYHQWHFFTDINEYGMSLGIGPGAASSTEAWQLWHHPDGNIAIRSSNQCDDGRYRWLYYSEVDDVFSVHCYTYNKILPQLTWKTDIDLPEAYFSGTISPPDAPSPPNGVWTDLLWNVTWTKGASIGYPPAQYFIRCTSQYSPCDRFDPNNKETAWVQAVNTQQVFHKHLLLGETYSCYTVASNIHFETCSDSVDMTAAPPPLQVYTFARPNGDTWKFGGGDGLHINTKTGQTLQLTIMSPATSGDSNPPPYVKVGALNTGIAGMNYLKQDPKYTFGDEPYNEALKIYRSGNGTFALYTGAYGGVYIAYNEGTDSLYPGMILGDNQIELFWKIVPDPPEYFIAGNFTMPGVPSTPDVGTFNGNEWTTNWTLSSWGSPEAKAKVVCVAPGQPCNATALAWSGAEPSSIDVQKAVVYGLIANSSQYDCYIMAKSVIGHTCSASPRTITVDPPAGPYYTLSMRNGTSLKSQRRPSDTWLFCFGCANSYNFTFAMVSCPASPSFSCPANHTQLMANHGLSKYVWFAGGYQTLDFQSTMAYTFYSSPSGGYALKVPPGFIIYNSDADNLYFEGFMPGSLIIFEMQPAPPAELISGTLKWADPPSQPATGSVSINTWTSTWTPGTEKGLPEATYFLRCVNSGGNCTSLPKFDSPSVVASTTTSMVEGLTVNVVYTCFGG